MNDGEDRLIGGEALQHDTVERADTALRPERLADFIGQGGGRANLETFIAAARDRGDAMDHTLLHDLENNPNGLPSKQARVYLWQIVGAVEFCHNRNVSVWDRTMLQRFRTRHLAFPFWTLPFLTRNCHRILSS